MVAQQGGEWLDQTIAGLAAQSRAPERIIAINNGGNERVSDQLATSDAERIVTSDAKRSFGQAISHALSVLPHDSADDSTERAERDWIWLLAEDSCPEPEALARILSTVERAPSVALAGPKLVDWDHPERIIELGQSLTRYGSRWLLRRQELDQQQYDHLQDVLGVGPVGLLVRRDVWEQLGGFDPALPVHDDGLDLSVRARLAGYRVVVSPASRVRFAQSGIAGPRVDRRRHVMRATHRQARTAHLHRRIAYAPGFFAFFMWLGLPILGVLRVFWSLIREQPGQMLGEFVSALHVFFRPGAILASRRRIKENSKAGWESIRALRVDPKSVRTARMIDREAILAAQGRQPREMHFVSTGGLGVLIAAVVISTALCWWALTNTSLAGGALAPLSPIDELWRNTRTIGGISADPFSWVLAVLGSLTFWNPSHAVVLLFILAIPLAALGGWIWSAQICESAAGRVLVGLGWAISPVLLGSLDSGRLPTLILAVVLPWLLLAATRCRESWSWAGTASLLAAVALACAPILIPAGILLLIVGACTSLRGITRVLTTALAPLALFGPKAVQVIIGGRPLDLFLDPGITPAYVPGNNWHLLLGFPEFGLEGWARVLENIGLGGPPATLLVGVLLVPIALLALLGLFTGKVGITILNALIGGVGMLTAIAAANLQLVTVGSETVALWTGSGLALYWLSILTLAAVGAETLRRAAPAVVAVALLAATVVVAPLGAQLVTASTGLTSGDQQLPAIVQAAGQSDPHTRTLVLTAEGEQAVRAQVVTGTGVRLDQLRTGAQQRHVTDDDRNIAALVGELASTGDDELREALDAENISFVLLHIDGDDQERAQLQAVFDQHTVLSAAGNTDYGLLWRVDASETESNADEHVTQIAGTSLSGHTLWWAQLIVLLGIVLLALPTGEVVERPPRRKRKASKRLALVGADAPAEVADEGTVTAEPAEPAEPEPAEPVVDSAADSPADSPADQGSTSDGPAARDPSDTAHGDTPPSEGGER